MTLLGELPFATAVASGRRRSELRLPAATLVRLDELVARISRQPAISHAQDVAVPPAAGGGVTALFTGPSGTGKTMAAEVLANETGRSLYRVGFRALVSKYIGETEKNLRRVFAAAEPRQSILLFDEADGIFGKRSEVEDSNDRYANIEVSYILSQIKIFRGVAIVTTSLGLASNDDVVHREHFVVEFPRPSR
jgi:SpoVK/Ycf46/Vps4 family AAA+-type ATPase